MSLVEQIRQPEYTGENRCTPCTIVNLGIALVAGAAVGIASTVSGIGVFGLSVGAIYYRGYLVPGTPTLTKQYFPDWLLRRFDKAAESTAPLDQDGIEVDPERVLLDAGAVEPCREGTDLCLTEGFQQTWRERIAEAREQEQELDEEYLAGALAVPLRSNGVTIDQHGEAFVATLDEEVIGQWSSDAAVIADVAAAAALNDRTSMWSTLSPAETARVLMSLRVFLEQCPACGGHVRLDQEVVESCCRSYDVVASACEDCGERLFEMEWDAAGDDAEASPGSDLEQPARGAS